MIKGKKIDFNDEANISSIVSQIASEKTGKKIKINMKLIAIIVAFLALSGLISDIYWLIKLILFIF